MLSSLNSNLQHISLFPHIDILNVKTDSQSRLRHVCNFPVTHG